MIVRLVRMLPLMAILAVVAGIVYLVEAYRHSPNRAKEVLIKVFLVITIVLAGFFGLVSLYAAADGNTPVLELALAFCMVGVLGLAVTLVCRYVFLKHHPSYRIKSQRSRTIHPWEKWARLIADILQKSMRR